MHGGGAQLAGDFSPGRYLINANFRLRSRVNGSSQGKIHSVHSERQNSFRSDLCNICGGKLSGQTNTRIYSAEVQWDWTDSWADKQETNSRKDKGRRARPPVNSIRPLALSNYRKHTFACFYPKFNLTLPRMRAEAE